MKRIDLTKQYTEEINYLINDALSNDNINHNCVFEQEHIIGRLYLGTNYNLFPSGKYYTCWTTNQTFRDIVKDDLYMSILEETASKYDCYINYDCDNIFLEKTIPLNEYESVKFVSKIDEKEFKGFLVKCLTIYENGLI